MLDRSVRQAALYDTYKAMRYRRWNAIWDGTDGDEYIPEIHLKFSNENEYIIRSNKQGLEVVTQVGLGEHNIGFKEVYIASSPYSSCIGFFSTDRRK